MSDKLHEEIAAFFDDFVSAFATFSGARVAELYLAPTVAVRADGSVDCLQTAEEVARFFQAALEGYRAGGTAACRYSDLDVFPMGARSVLATVTWQLLREDGSVIDAWHQSYNLVRSGERWRVLVSTHHVG